MSKKQHFWTQIHYNNKGSESVLLTQWPASPNPAYAANIQQVQVPGCTDVQAQGQ